MPPDDPIDRSPRYLAAGMAELPADDRWLTGPEAGRLRAMTYTKRREESRLGRWTAKRALAQALDLDRDDPTVLRELTIGNRPTGAPEAFHRGRPAAVSISMTDRADWAVCTVVAGDRPIGCDLELVEPRSPAFVADYFTPAERERVARDPDANDLLANLIWSAKESALKVLQTGLRRDTRSVEVHLGRSGEGAWCELEVTTIEGAAFAGWWRRFGPFVLTCVGAEPILSPRSLVDPSPLHRAVPGHSWIADPRPRPRPRPPA